MRPFTDDRREALRERVRAFVAARPRRGREEADPRALVRALGDAGLLRLLVPAAHGGASELVEPLSLVVVREELAFAGGLTDALFAVQGLAAWPLAQAGGAALCREWLPRLASGEAIGAFAMTEPEAGSDVAATATTASSTAEGYRLDGHKVFISNAGLADLYLVLARLAPGDHPPTAGAPAPAGEGPARFAAFVVPASTPGVETAPLELLGAHLVGSVRLRGAVVPAAARLGTEGDGLPLFLRTLELFRPTVGASACGLAARALDEARRRVSIRRQFGQPLAALDTVKFKLAEMATGLDAARLLVYRAAWVKEEALRRGDDRRTAREASMAKLFATETAQSIVDEALQLHGAAGLVRGGVLESLYREVRALRIYEGTSEIQKLVIARALLTP